MKQLILMRHAHAQDGTAGLTDAARALDAHGRLQAAVAATRLRTHELLPDAILTSPAVRAHDTALIVAQQLRLAAVPLRNEPQLYLCDSATLLNLIRGCDARINCLLLVGHNPGLSDLVEQFETRSQGELPTAGLCSLSLAAQSWQEFAPGAARCRRL